MLAWPRILFLLIVAMTCLTGCPAKDGAHQDAKQHSVEQTTGGSDGAAADAAPAGMGSGLQQEAELPIELPPLPAPSAATNAATLATIGNFRGFQKPCSCTPEQNGGLARLGSLMHVMEVSAGYAVAARADGAAEELPTATDIGIDSPLEDEPLWLLELGNFSYNRLHFPGLRARTHLQVLAAIGARAAIPGSDEMALDLSDAVYALSNSPLPLVSCNLATETEGIRITPSLQLAENWFLLGISSATDNQGNVASQDWWTFTDAREAALAELKGLPADCHVIAAGANLEPELAKELLQDPRVAICIGVPERYQRMNASEPAMFRDPPAKSTSLDLYSIDAAGSINDWRQLLDEELPDDPRVMALIKHEGQLTNQRLREQRAQRAALAGGMDKPEFGMSNKFLPEDMREFSYADDPSYVGGEECMRCHRDAVQAWRTSRHAGALYSLKQEGQADMLDCLSCHSTGLLQQGGYDPLEPEDAMSSVGCEACHGPGSHHVHFMQNPNDTEGKPEGLLIDRMPVDGCVRCHDPYNSPHFEMGEYWEKIAH